MTQVRTIACDSGPMPRRPKSRYPGAVVALSRRVLGCVLAIAIPLGVAPQQAWAGPSRKAAKSAKEPKEAKPTPEEEAALAEARDLFEQGKAKYDTFDYKGAIDLWQQAYAKVPPREAGVRHAMVYNIALAQEKSYDLDKDVAHLRQAVLLLEQWVKDFKQMYPKTPETAAEVDKANQRIAELKRKIAIAEGTEPPPEEPPPAEEGEPPPPPTSQIEFDSGYTPPPEVLQERRRQAAENESEGLIAAGWAVGGIGLLFAAAGAGTLAGVRNTAGRGGGGGGLGLGVAMIIAGSVLLGVGYKKKKAVAAGDYSIAPTGAGMTVRF